MHLRSEYLERVAATEPVGEWWERCAFLEETLGYIEFTCRRFYPPEQLAGMCLSIAHRAAEPADTMPADQPPDRAARLVARTRSLADRLQHRR